jgi:peptidyl-prolyl cis-trans isomerase A (cyclophilin A)
MPNVMKKIALIALLALLGWQITGGAKMANQTENVYAVLETSLGKIVCQLYPEQAPLTVKNFVGLSKGEQPWLDPQSKEIVKKPLYNETIFHRVIPDFMIQGGDPLGNGMGGPGYKFDDEFSDDLQFDQVGRLAMANSGPRTNGSQFFITVAETPWLNNRHTIFGQVVSGMEIVEKISLVERDGNDRPKKEVVLKNVTITDKLPGGK